MDRGVAEEEERNRLVYDLIITTYNLIQVLLGLIWLHASRRASDGLLRLHLLLLRRHASVERRPIPDASARSRLLTRHGGSMRRVCNE